MKRLFSVFIILSLLLCMVVTGAADGSITVTFSIYQHVDEEYLIRPSESTVQKGETVLTFLKKTVGQTLTLKDQYVVGMYGFNEYDHGPQSGWIYKVNGKRPNVSAANCVLKDNDNVEWIYMTSLEQWGSQSSSGETTASKPTASTAGTTTVPNVTTTSGTRQSTTVLSLTSSQSTQPVSSATTAMHTTETQATTTAQVFTPPATTKKLPKSVNDLVEPSLAYLRAHPGDYTALVFRLFDETIPREVRTSMKQQTTADSLLLTDLERLLITISALGEDPDTFSSRNLSSSVYNTSNIMAQGLIGVVFALMALPHADLSGEEQHNADSLIKSILQNQNADGSFALAYNMEGDVDITAMALTSLSAYKNRADVSLAIDHALQWLSDRQNSDGSFSSYQVPNCESTAQVLIALSSLQIDITDTRFVKNHDILTALASFATNFAFSHEKDGADNVLATEQALLAISAYQQKTNPYSVVFKTEQAHTSIYVWITAGVGLALLAAAGGFGYFKKKKKAGAEKSE